MTRQQPLGQLLRARAIHAQGLTREVCAELNGCGIVPAPLKSVLLNSTVYRDAPPCPVGDVDLLVDAADFRRAEAVVSQMGGQLLSARRHASTWRLPHGLLLLDLHRHIVDPAWFRMPSEVVLGRATSTDELIGAETRLLERYDVYAHLVADFARSRRGVWAVERLRDLRVWAREHHLEPVAAAGRLSGFGLGRAARYALGIASYHGGDPFALATLEALPPDMLGGGIASVARRVMGPAGDGDWRTLPLGHALNSSLSKGARSLLRSLARL